MTLEDRMDALNFEVEKSIRYHQRRRAFFERMDRFSTFLVILLGSATVAAWAPKVTGLMTTVIGAATLVLGFSGKARDHLILAQKFTDLARQIRGKAEPTEADVREWESEKLLIDAAEPAIYRALEVDCYIEVCRAWGRPLPVNLRQPSFHHKLFMHLWRFEKEDFEKEPPVPAPTLATG